LLIQQTAPRTAFSQCTARIHAGTVIPILAFTV
jgi:hypothetical protein